MTRYLFPHNLKAKANIWLWQLRDFAVIGIAILLSVIALVSFRWLVPTAITLCYAFLTVRLDDTSIMDYMRYAIRYFIVSPQYYEWR